MEVTLQSLMENGAERLALHVLSGEQHLSRRISETAMNRPGLALTGFFRYFANRRLQIFGLAEFTYLKSLEKAERRGRIEGLFGRQIPGIVVTRNRRPLPEMLELAERFRVPVLRTPMVTMDFVNQCTVILEQLKAPRERVPGTAMELMGIGVLLQGAPGIGKSETALALVERGYSLVSDDVTEMRLTSRGRLLCRANHLTRYHMEIRGLGIIHVPSLFGVAAVSMQTELDLVVELTSPTGVEERVGAPPKVSAIMGVEVSLITLPVRSGRDMANIVEVAALNQKLKGLGHDAAKEFDKRLIERLSGGGRG